MTNEKRAKTLGAHHVGLTVSDLRSARRFFEEVLGFALLAEDDSYPSAFVTDGVTLITLWQVEDPSHCRPFDRRRNVGLHHLALRVEPQSLKELARAIAAHNGAELEFRPEPLDSTELSHMMCRIPGGPRLELVAA